MNDEALVYIQFIWNQDFDYTNFAIKIAQSFSRKIPMLENVIPLDKERHLIEKLRESYELQPELVEALLNLVSFKYRALDAWGAKASLEREIGELIEKTVEQARSAEPRIALSDRERYLIGDLCKLHGLPLELVAALLNLINVTFIDTERAKVRLEHKIGELIEEALE